jgi:hypothetical protein
VSPKTKQDESTEASAGGRVAGESPRLRTWVNWTFFASAALYSLFHAGFVVWQTVVRDPRLFDMVYKHYAAFVGLPFAGFGALGLVLLLESRSEKPIEFRALGFEFKGASGPIVLWVLSFLAIVLCFRMMWSAG